MKNLLLYSMLVLAFILLALQKWFFSAVVFASFLSGVLFALVMKKMGFEHHHILIVYLALWLSIIGELGLYLRWDIYDKLLHLIVPFFLAYIIGFYISKTNLKHKKTIIFLVVLGMGAFFEVFEFLSDVLLGLNMGGVTNISGELLMDEWRDTILDLIMTMLGTIGFFIFRSKYEAKTFNHNNNS